MPVNDLVKREHNSRGGKERSGKEGMKEGRGEGKKGERRSDQREDSFVTCQAN